jgi:hypothetical protein
VRTHDLDEDRNDRFEAYLKQFRPLAVEPLQMEKPGRATRRRFVLAAWAVAVAVIFIAVALAFHARADRSQAAQVVSVAVRTERIVNTEPLTIRSANALLAAAPSFKAAVDGMAFRRQVAPLPRDKHSALDTLSKEKTKL